MIPFICLSSYSQRSKNKLQIVVQWNFAFCCILNCKLVKWVNCFQNELSTRRKIYLDIIKADLHEDPVQSKLYVFDSLRTLWNFAAYLCVHLNYISCTDWFFAYFHAFLENNKDITFKLLQKIFTAFVLINFNLKNNFFFKFILYFAL